MLKQLRIARLRQSYSGLFPTVNLNIKLDTNVSVALPQPFQSTQHRKQLGKYLNQMVISYKAI